MCVLRYATGDQTNIRSDRPADKEQEESARRHPKDLPAGSRRHRLLTKHRDLTVRSMPSGKAAPVLDVANLELHELTAEDDRVVALLHIPLRNGGGSALISEHLRLRAGKAIALQAFWFDAGVVTTTG